MILILTSADDQSTLEVIRWLNWYQIPWIKIDPTLPLTFIELVLDAESEEFILETDSGKRIDTRTITAYWYRRGQFNLNIQYALDGLIHETTRRQFESHIKSEINLLVDSLHLCLSQKKRLNSIHTSNPNKHFMLSTAKKVGLAIPETLVTTRKSVFTNFEAKNGPLISKAIHHGIRFKIFSNENWVEYLTYTESFDQSDLPEQHFPTLFQTKITKDYELRIFYLAGSFYCMAIFSQKDEQTAVDFRNYNFEKPNRNVPYALPEDVKQKLIQLMKRLDMESGSIDMVVTHENKFIFLEVNPIGQYGMVSIPCNYYLDEKIAHYLKPTL